MLVPHKTFVWCASAAMLAGCAAPKPPPAPAATATVPATPVAVHIATKSNGGRYVTVVQQIKGRTVYALRAQSSTGDFSGASSAVGTFEQPHIVFHDRNGKVLVADAPEAKVTQRDKSVIMSGGVHARAQDGGVLSCDTLVYDGRTERLRGDGHVVLNGPNGTTLTGEHLDGDVRLDDVHVTGNPG